MFKEVCSNGCSVVVATFNETTESGFCSKEGCEGVIIIVSQSVSI